MARTCPGCGYRPIGPFTDSCPMCGESVYSSSDDRRGGPAPGSSPLLRWVIGGSLAMLFVVAGCCGLGAWRGNRDFEQQIEEAQRQAEADRKTRTVAVSAAQLVQEFQANPTAADQKYRRKYLEIGGVVERNGTDRDDDSPFLVLHAGDENAKLRIECFFDLEDDAEEARLKQLKKGDAVVVRGEYSGQISNVQVRDCVLVK